MQVLQLIGILIVVISLTCAAWFISHDKPRGAGGVAVLIVSIVTGLALTFHERAIEISFGKVATLKAAAQQATTDAQEIATIRHRVEAQAATLDLVAKESSDAKRLLGDLRKENENADEKLKQLEQKTSEIVRLPDGRMKMGILVTGSPSVLMEHFDLMLAAYKDREFEVAYREAKTAIKLYEDSKKALTDHYVSAGGTLKPEDVATLYGIGAELAQRFSEHDTALAWAQSAVAAKPSPERRAFLVTALLHAKKTEEAKKLVDETIAEGGEDAEKFKALLQEIGVLNK
jgi:BMFP domain-containing protein YqiC